MPCLLVLVFFFSEPDSHIPQTALDLSFFFKNICHGRNCLTACYLLTYCLSTFSSLHWQSQTHQKSHIPLAGTGHPIRNRRRGRVATFTQLGPTLDWKSPGKLHSLHIYQESAHIRSFQGNVERRLEKAWDAKCCDGGWIMTEPVYWKEDFLYFDCASTTSTLHMQPKIPPRVSFTRSFATLQFRPWSSKPLHT